MKFSRGQIVTAAFPGDLKKPRPAVIVQADEFIEHQRTVLACPFTTFIADAPLFRPTIQPSPLNGLQEVSQAMVDKLTPARKEVIGQVIGELSAEDMRLIEMALINITGLRSSLAPSLFNDES